MDFILNNIEKQMNKRTKQMVWKKKTTAGAWRAMTSKPQLAVCDYYEQSGGCFSELAIQEPALITAFAKMRKDGTIQTEAEAFPAPMSAVETLEAMIAEAAVEEVEEVAPVVETMSTPVESTGLGEVFEQAEPEVVTEPEAEYNEKGEIVGFKNLTATPVVETEEQRLEATLSMKVLPGFQMAEHPVLMEEMVAQLKFDREFDPNYIPDFFFGLELCLIDLNISVADCEQTVIDAALEKVLASGKRTERGDAIAKGSHAYLSHAIRKQEEGSVLAAMEEHLATIFPKVKYIDLYLTMQAYLPKQLKEGKTIEDACKWVLHHNVNFKPESDYFEDVEEERQRHLAGPIKQRKLMDACAEYVLQFGMI